jgi:hypothetical protein
MDEVIRHQLVFCDGLDKEGTESMYGKLYEREISAEIIDSFLCDDSFNLIFSSKCKLFCYEPE